MKRLFDPAKFFVFAFVCLLLSTTKTFSQVKLPRIVRDSMILQRDTKLKIWGWASKNEKVNVKFNGKTYKTKADANGNWSVWVAPVKAGGPYTMDITASNKITLKDILIGDVWLCTGQSNMVHQLNIHDVRYADEIKNANNPAIRQFWIPTLATVAGPKDDLPAGFWQPAIGEQVRPFSAVAYFFAKYINAKYKIPIGIINASVGGTPIETWMSEDGFKEFPNILNTIARNKDTTNRGNRGAPNTGGPGRAAARPEDKGMTEKWFDPSYKPKGWFPFAVPGFWEDQGVKDLNGIVWFRREIDVPASMTTQPAKVFLGRIVDADELYINGTRVANTTYMYPQRRYPVPNGILKPGKNLLVVRVTNNSGKGGFVPDKPYQLFAGNDTIDLTGYWEYKVGQVNVPAPRGNFGGGGGGPVNAQNAPTGLYNAMTAPIVNYAIKGVLWYQGESNVGRHDDYAKIQPAMIADYRNKWSNPDLPFLFVQLPGFGDYNYLPSESSQALLREAQAKSLSVPNTAMAVTIDVGEWNDIHPDRKKEVGERLAVAADNMVYGDKAVISSGPLFESASVEGNRIIVSFKHTGSGLATSDGEELKEFAIAGDDKKFVWAKAKIEGDKIVVSSDAVTQPKYVRYAWADTPVYPNLINKEGLPASPFRTDK